MGTTTRVSISNSNAQSNSDSWSPVITADGRYTVFESDANNLTPIDSNHSRDIFIRDRVLGTTTRVSVNSYNTQGNNNSYSPDISGNGRFVTYVSNANNLVPGDDNGLRDIFMRDTATNKTTKINILEADNGESYQGSDSASISDDGRYIAVAACFTNPLENYTSQDILLYDSVTGIQQRVTTPIEGNYYVGNPEISGDGNYLVFESNANHLVPGDTNNRGDIFLYNRQNGTTTRISVGPNGVQSDGVSTTPSISRDGRIVAFRSFASNLGPGSNNVLSSIFIHDRINGITTAIPRPNLGPFGVPCSPSISPDGRYVGFVYTAGLTTGLYKYDRQTNSLEEIHTVDIASSAIGSGVDIQGESIPIIDEPMPIVDVDCFYRPCLSDGGHYIAFESNLNNIVPMDTNNARDIFVYDIYGLPAVINGTSGNDVINGASNPEIINGLGGNDQLFGHGENDTLDGGDGNDTLNGGVGMDLLKGGPGNDTYVVDNVGKVILELTNQGTDIISSSVSYTLPNNVENLTLTGSAAINGTGNTLNNLITGNSANNILNGGPGNDRHEGGTGNDTYIIDSVGDVVVELPNRGIDTVNINSFSYTLPSQVENLTLTGCAAINGTGNTLNNIITGNSVNNVLNGGVGNDTLNGGAGNDSLDGGVGSDRLEGGAGNDTYFVDSIGDLVVELPNQGIDTVNISFSYTLPNNVENLTLTGNAAINGTGNTLNNIIAGNSANNVLNGGVGNDTLNGGAGNDTLNGGAGNDFLSGGEGNDTYFVDSLSDRVYELSATGGIDTVNATVSYTIGNNLENLTLTGNAAINGTGNTLNNLITGNSGNNILMGGGDNDTLNGGAGNDTLIGGVGNDTLNGGVGQDKFRFNSLVEGVDRIPDFNVADDTIEMYGNVVSLPPGFVDPSRFVIGAAATNSIQRFIYNKNTGDFFFDKDGNGSQVAVQIANLPAFLNPTSNDIFLL